jgi:hypothetical protein
VLFSQSARDTVVARLGLPYAMQLVEASCHGHDLRAHEALQPVVTPTFFFDVVRLKVTVLVFALEPLGCQNVVDEFCVYVRW